MPGTSVTCTKSSLGCPPRRLIRRDRRLERPTFGLTIAKPQSRVVVGQDSPQLCECQILGATIVQMRLVQLAAQADRPPYIPARRHGPANR